jgi:hypothetical protein
MVETNPHCTMTALRIIEYKANWTSAHSQQVTMMLTKSRVSDFMLKRFPEDEDVDDVTLNSFPILITNPCLFTSLHLVRCGLAGEGMKQLSQLLQQDHYQVVDLNLSWNFLGQDGGVEALCASIAKRKLVLNTLDISGNQLTHFTLHADKVRKLQLEMNRLDFKQFQAMWLALSTNHKSCLQRLSIGYNSFCPQAWKFLAQQVSKQSASLRHLDVGCCGQFGLQSFVFEVSSSFPSVCCALSSLVQKTMKI